MKYSTQVAKAARSGIQMEMNYTTTLPALIEIVDELTTHTTL